LSKGGRSRLLLAAIVGSILLPIGIGTISGVGLESVADGNETYPFAANYYRTLLPKNPEYLKKRGEYAQTGFDRFGSPVTGLSECQRRLLYMSAIADRGDEDMLIGDALASQRSRALEVGFDRPAIVALESLSSPVVGALKGCRYTIVGFFCAQLGLKVVDQANDRDLADLKARKEKWIIENENASCAAADAMMRTLPNPANPPSASNSAPKHQSPD